MQVPILQNGKSTQPQNGKHAAPQNGKHPQPQNGKLPPPQNGKHAQLQNGKHKPLHPLGLQYPALWGRDQPFRDASPLTWGQAHSLPTGSGGTLKHLPESVRTLTMLCAHGSLVRQQRQTLGQRTVSLQMAGVPLLRPGARRTSFSPAQVAING